jgi:4-amino-4-deoxy-L-arabinose transferase-like glycosyltransferase
MHVVETSDAGSEAATRRSGLAAFLCLVAVALAAQLAVFAVDARHDPPYDAAPDTRSYVLTAQLLRGVGDPTGREHRLGERTIGYPGLIALCFELGIGSADDPRPVIGVQIVLGALVAGFAFVAAAAIAGPVAGVAAGLLAAFEPSGLGLANVLLSETLYTFLMAATIAAWSAVALGAGTGALVALGAALGLAPLVKPVAMFLPFVLVPLAALTLPRTPGGRAGMAVLFASALLPSFLAATYHRAEIGQFTLSRQGPLQQAIFAYDVERALGIPEPPATSDEAVWDFNYGKAQGLTREEIDRRRSDFVRRTLTAHPWVAVRLALVNFVEMIGVPDDALALQGLARPPTFVGGSVVSRVQWLLELRALGAYLLLGVAVSFLGLAAIPWLAWRGRRWTPQRRAAVAGVAFIVLYQFALSSFATGQGARYRAPVMPALGVLAVVAAAEALRARSGAPSV